MSEYLTKIEVLYIHHEQIQRYGGLPGIRDEGLLEAALYRPQTGYYADVIEEAAALWESLSQNHPFIDGNKRTGFVVGILFLETNGYRFVAPEEDATRAVLDLAAGLLSEKSFAKWLNTVVKRRRGRA